MSRLPDDAWVQWGVFHSDANARRAVEDEAPGRVRYRRLGQGRVEVLVPRRGPEPAPPPAGTDWSLCPDHADPLDDYGTRARAVYWPPGIPACRAKGPQKAVCLLDPGHEGDHFGNGHDAYGPKGAIRWAR